MIKVNNSYVVRHNHFLAFASNVNVEAVYGNCGGKYAFKYVTKGSDCAYVKIATKNSNEVEYTTTKSTIGHQQSLIWIIIGHPVPVSQEKFDISLLLFHVKDSKSFEDFKRVNDDLCANFLETAIKLSLLDDKQV